jgi:hypothetical protein
VFAGDPGEVVDDLGGADAAVVAERIVGDQIDGAL